MVHYKRIETIHLVIKNKKTIIHDNTKYLKQYQSE